MGDVIEEAKKLILSTVTFVLFLTAASGQYDDFFKELRAYPPVNDMPFVEAPQSSAPDRTQRMPSLGGHFLPLADHSSGGSMADNPFSISDWAFPPINLDTHIYSTEPTTPEPDKQKLTDGNSAALAVLKGSIQTWQWSDVLEKGFSTMVGYKDHFYGMACCQRLPYICNVDGLCTLETRNCEAFCECAANPHANHCLRTIPRLKKTMRDLEKKTIVKLAQENGISISSEVARFLATPEEPDKASDGKSMALAILDGRGKLWQWEYVLENLLDPSNLNGGNFYGMECCQRLPYICGIDGMCLINPNECEGFCECAANPHASYCRKTIPRLKQTIRELEKKAIFQVAMEQNMLISPELENVLMKRVETPPTTQSPDIPFFSTWMFPSLTASSPGNPLSIESLYSISLKTIPATTTVTPTPAATALPTTFPPSRPTTLNYVTQPSISRSTMYPYSSNTASNEGRVKYITSTIPGKIPSPYIAAVDKPTTSTKPPNLLATPLHRSTPSQFLSPSRKHVNTSVLPAKALSVTVPTITRPSTKSSTALSNSPFIVPPNSIAMTPPTLMINVSASSHEEPSTRSSKTPESTTQFISRKATTGSFSTTTKNVIEFLMPVRSTAATHVPHQSMKVPILSIHSTTKGQVGDLEDHLASLLFPSESHSTSSKPSAVISPTPQSNYPETTYRVTTPKSSWTNSTAGFQEEIISLSEEHENRNGESESMRNVSARSCAGCEENGGVCVMGNDFSAHCVKTFTGDACEHFRCVHGSCISTDGFYSCECFDGWTGTFCDKTCRLHCGDNGFCGQVDDGQTIACVCHWNYTGDRCDQERAIIPRITEVSLPGEDFQLWEVAIIAVVTAVLLALFCILLPYWLWRRQWLPIRKLVFFFKDYEDDDDKEYDAFISYKSCPRDERFVLNHLYPKLEKELDFRLCLHFRDFPPGHPIANNIIHAVENSRRTILILSPSYIKSEWCRMEYQKAQHEMLRLKHKIIPIILEDIDGISEIDQNLKTIIDTVTYIKWPGEVEPCMSKRILRFWKLLELSMPKKRTECGQSFSSSDSSASELSLTNSSKTCFNSIVDSLSNFDDSSTSTFSTQFKGLRVNSHNIEKRNEQKRNAKHQSYKTSPLTFSLTGSAQYSVINDITYSSWLSTCDKKLSLSEDSAYLGSDDNNSNSNSWSCQSSDSCDCVMPLKPHLNGSMKCSKNGETNITKKREKFNGDYQYPDNMLRDTHVERESTTFVHNDNCIVQIMNLENNRK